ncbi:hypothetical protein Emtol_0775 [Emticicia oligotrophica DSM 17448]|uniref:Uncharacterized protein n=1 Tax=Emticicia oligotrophica (strain DSM 17448 / CIP 109782 / MTCC 6937 / GPTSA100-15) TaxID=929562 RepID=A0ABN4AIP5_EMTOG|nr:hypothetical protein [Emticicia oligotrophica]AFK01927.1 hypothetical protein Emtol_0775 [Emticicia oligotrophica DSM 17448]
MRLLFLKIYCFALFSTVSFANEPAKKYYTEEECKILNLKPIILPSGEQIMPQHDGENYFVKEKQSQQNSASITPEEVKERITKAKNAGKKVYDLLSLQYISSLPIVIEKEIAGTTYAIALDNLVFTPAGNTLTIVAMITTPEGNNICFAGEQIGFTGQGGIKEGTLRLVLGGKNTFELFDLDKISLELTGGSIKFGCNGYESFSLQGNVIFDRSLIVPDNVVSGEPQGGNVSSKFILENIQDWNNMLIDISMQPFQIPSMKGYGFNVSHAVIDISDHANSPNCIFPTGYTAAETGALWRGVFIGNVTVRFPKHFKNRATQSRLSIGVNNLLIDKIGVSGEVFGENIMSIKEGDLSGWDYSIDGASIILVKSKVKAGSLMGKMRVSISSEEKLLGYKAIIDPTRDYYNFSVNAAEELDFEVFKAAKVHLEPASTVSLMLENEQFSATALLHGKMNIISLNEGVSLEEFTFQNLFLSTKSPYLSIGFFGGGSDKEHQLGGFPISIIAPKVLIQNNVADINFGVRVNLDDVGISATGGFVIQGAFVNENNRHFWRNKKFALQRLEVNADLSVGQFKGIIDFFNNDPVYGRGFYGEMGMTLDVGLKIEARAVAIFGNKEKRYWFVDGELSSGGNGNGLSINVLAGCLYKHMSPVPGKTGAKSLSGVVYAPNFSIGWGGRFAIGITTGGSMAGLAGLEIVTHNGGGISKIGILGSVIVAGDGWRVTPEAGQIMYQKLCSDSDLMQPGGIANNTDGDTPPEGQTQKFDVNAPKGFGASIMLKINFDERSYYGKLGVNASTTSISVQFVGAFYFSPTKWFVHLGEPPIADRIIILLPSLPQIDGYIMLGHGVPELPSPEPNIFVKYPSEINKRSSNISSGQVASGTGIAFGAALTVSSQGTFPNNANNPILAYNIGARIGLDMMLMKYGNGAYCEGREGQPIGINSWRAAGQVYAIGWLKGKAFGFDVLDIGLGAVLGGAAPNPTYGAGEVAVSFKVLFKKFNFNVGFTVGDDCVILGSDVRVSNEEVFENLYPSEGQELLAKETQPNIVFSNDIETPTHVEGLNGNFRQKIINYSLSDEGGNTIGGSWIKENDKKIVFRPTSALPAGKKITVRVHVQFQKEEGGNWQPFNEGTGADTQKEYYFTTTKNVEEFKKDISEIVKNAEETGKEIKEEAKVVAEEINKYAEDRGKQIEETAKQEAEKINEMIDDRGKAILEKAENANITQEKKEEVKQIVNTATGTATKVVDEALLRVHNIVENAKIEVIGVTNEAVLKVEATVEEAENKVIVLNTNGENEITSLNNELIALKRNLEAQRRNELKWRILKKKRNEIKEKYRKLANDADGAYHKKMQEVVDRIKAQSDAEMAAAKQRGKEIMEEAKIKAKEIMDKAESQAEGVMAEARKIADEIMAEAEKQSDSIINGTSNAKADLSVFAQIAQKISAFYDEADEATVQTNDTDNDLDETKPQPQPVIEEEIAKPQVKEARGVEPEQLPLPQIIEPQPTTYNVEQQRLEEEWLKNEELRKQREREEEERSRQAYEAEQRRLEEERQRQEAYEAEQRRIQDEQQRQAFEAEQRRLEEERQTAYFQYLEELARQKSLEEERQRQRQREFEEEQRLYRLKQLEESPYDLPFVDIKINDW